MLGLCLNTYSQDQKSFGPAPKASFYTVNKAPHSEVFVDNPNPNNRAFLIQTSGSAFQNFKQGLSSCSPVSFGSTFTMGFPAGYGVAGGHLYAIDQLSPFTLYQVDTSTGAMTNLGTCTGVTLTNMTGLAYDPVGSQMYAIQSNLSQSQIMTLNLTTRVFTPVGSPSSVCAGAIALGCPSTGNLMYAVDLVADNLYSVDKTTGVFTLVGPLGINANFGQDAAFDLSDNTFYWASYNSTSGLPELRIINTTTGGSTLVCSWTPQTEGIAIGPFSSGTTYGPPELLYYKIENNPSQVLTPNCASAPVGTNPAPVGGVNIGTGGQFDSCLIGTGNTGTNGINTGWNCNLAGTSWTISFWVSNLAEVVSGNPTYLFGDPGSTTFRCFYGGFALPNNAVVRGPMADLIFACPMPGSYTFHIVYNGTTVTVYRNGTLLTSENATFTMPTGTGFRVAGYTGGAYSLNTGGKLDEFRLYSRALTAAEIAATWNMDLACGLVGIKQVGNQIPGTYALSQNYPNPFNPSTTIKFEVPKAGNVEMKVFDALGKEVGTIVNEYKQAGSYSVQFNGDKIASGVYFYKITAGDFTATKKMLLVK